MTSIFLASFLGSLASLTLVGVVVVAVIRRDIAKTQESIQNEMNRGKELMAEFLATASAMDSTNETIN